MNGQEVVVAIIVAAAFVFVVWKLFLADRRPRRKRGPDVPLSRLRKRK
jgi:hypothetical protein